MILLVLIINSLGFLYDLVIVPQRKSLFGCENTVSISRYFCFFTFVDNELLYRKLVSVK